MSNLLPVIEYFPKRHRYKVNGKYSPSVTKILDILDKPALRAWAIKKTIEYLKQNFEVLRSDQTSDLLARTIIEAAANKGEEAKEAAASIGSLAHSEISKIVKGIKRWDESDERVRHITDEFMRWCKDVQFQIIHSELTICSVTHWYAGTLDLICNVEGRKTLADLKTGNRIREPEMGKQLAAYRMGFEELYPTVPPIEQMMIVRIGREDGFLQGRLFPDYEFYRQGFLHTLQIHNWHRDAESRARKHEREVAA